MEPGHPAEIMSPSSGGPEDLLPSKAHPPRAHATKRGELTSHLSHLPSHPLRTILFPSLTIQALPLERHPQPAFLC